MKNCRYTVPHIRVQPGPRFINIRVHSVVLRRGQKRIHGPLQIKIRWANLIMQRSSLLLCAPCIAQIKGSRKIIILEILHMVRFQREFWQPGSGTTLTDLADNISGMYLVPLQLENSSPPPIFVILNFLPKFSLRLHFFQHDNLPYSSLIIKGRGYFFQFPFFQRYILPGLTPLLLPSPADLINFPLGNFMHP